MRIFLWTIMLFGMWMILSSNIQLANIIIGLTLSIFVSFIYEKMFTHEKLELINPYYFAIYLLILIKNLIISNIQIAIRVLSPDMKLNPMVVEVKTNLKSDWKKLLLANSITLTPGTLTLDVVDDVLFIHVIECKDINEKAKITKEFEDIIAKI